MDNDLNECYKKTFIKMLFLVMACEHIYIFDFIVKTYSIKFFSIKAAFKCEPSFPEVGSEIIPPDGHLE